MCSQKAIDITPIQQRETSNQNAPEVPVGFYKPNSYEQTKRLFQSTVGRNMRKRPNLTTGLIFFSDGALFLAAVATTVTTGLDPLLIAGVSTALAGAGCLTAIGINRLTKHVLKEKYPDKLYNNVNSILGFSLSGLLLASSACAMASPSAVLIYPAIAFAVSTLFFLGNTTARTFPKLGSDIKAITGFNPLKFFETYPDVSLVAAGSAIVAGRVMVPAIDSGSMISPTGVLDGVVAAMLGLGFTVLMAPARAREGIINKMGKINALLEDSGKDLGSLLEIENGKFKAKDGAFAKAQETARLLNKIYEQIYIYKGEGGFLQLEKSLAGDGLKAAKELLNAAHLQPFTDVTGKIVDDKKSIIEATEKAKQDIQKERADSTVKCNMDKGIEERSQAA